MTRDEAIAYIKKLPESEHVVVLRPAHTRKHRKGPQKRFQVPEKLAEEFEAMLELVGSHFGNNSREVEVGMVIGIVTATIRDDVTQ